MQILRSLVALAVVVGFTFAVSAADPTKKAAKKGTAVRGTIVSVDKADNTTTITVKTMPTKKDANAVAEEKKFKVTDATKIEKVIGKPKDGEVKPAAVSDLAKDLQVALVVKDDKVESIKVMEKKKK